MFAHGSRLVLFDLSRWEVIRDLEDVRLTPGYPFSGAYLPDGERLVIVEAGARVALLDSEGEVQWRFTVPSDPAWEGKWELPAWSSASVRCTGDAIVVGVGWIQRGPVEGDGHQDYEDRGREVVLGLDGTLLDRAPPELPAPPAATATIEKRSDRHELVVVRHGGTLVELDVTLAHGKPSAVAIARDASWLLIGTHRGLLLGYR